MTAMPIHYPPPHTASSHPSSTDRTRGAKSTSRIRCICRPWLWCRQEPFLWAWRYWLGMLQRSTSPTGMRVLCSSSTQTLRVRLQTSLRSSRMHRLMGWVVWYGVIQGCVMWYSNDFYLLSCFVVFSGGPLSSALLDIFVLLFFVWVQWLFCLYAFVYMCPSVWGFLLCSCSLFNWKELLFNVFLDISNVLLLYVILYFLWLFLCGFFHISDLG